MDPKAFVRTLADLEVYGIAKTDADLARLLGVHRNTIARMRQKGSDRRTDLAIDSLILRAALGPALPILNRKSPT